MASWGTANCPAAGANGTAICLEIYQVGTVGKRQNRAIDFKRLNSSAISEHSMHFTNLLCKLTGLIGDD
jgi:hypothetical protein